MILYISKEEALATLVAALMQNPSKSAAKRIKARMEWIREEIADGHDVNESLVKMAIETGTYRDRREED